MKKYLLFVQIMLSLMRTLTLWRNLIGSQNVIGEYIKG